MATKRFTRYTKGRNQQVIVSKATAVSAETTLALFVANATAGQIGVYDGDGNLHTNAITSGEYYTIVQKRSDGSIRKTTPQLWSDTTATRKAYVAPVKCVGSIGWSGTAGALNNPTIAAGQFFELAIIETTEGNQPFPTWNFEYKTVTGDVELDVLGALAKLINDPTSIQYRNNKRLVSAKVKADATYGNYAQGTGGTTTFTNGSVTVTTATGTINFAIGDYISVDAAATPSDSVGDIYKIVGNPDANTWTLNRAYQGATQTFTETESEGTRIKKVTVVTASGLEFTSLENIAHFRLVARQNLNAATIVNLASFARGNGDADMIGELEKEGNTFAGLTAGNTVFGNSAYGVEDLWVTDSTETYDTFNLVINKFVNQVAGGTRDNATLYITIAAPKSSGGISASLNTLFGT